MTRDLSGGSPLRRGEEERSRDQPCAETGPNSPSSPHGLAPLESELLAALKKATHYVALYESEHMSNVALDVYIECNAAIAKAEGRS